MTDGMLLRLLQGGASFFPSGAFSWELETLCADGVVSSEKDGAVHNGAAIAALVSI
jgi:urease accessory protein UreF